MPDLVIGSERWQVGFGSVVLPQSIGNDFYSFIADDVAGQIDAIDGGGFFHYSGHHLGCLRSNLSS